MKTLILISVMVPQWHVMLAGTAFFVVLIFIFSKKLVIPATDQQALSDREMIRNAQAQEIEKNLSEIQKSIDDILDRFKKGVSWEDRQEIQKESEVIHKRLIRMSDPDFCTMDSVQQLTHTKLTNKNDDILNTLTSIEDRAKGLPGTTRFPFEVNLCN